MSLIGATSMALALLVGCGDDDNKPVSSQLGQSCVRTADCAEGLSCIANTCYKAGSGAAGAGGGASVPTPPVLGGEGESCTSRLDCKADLGCFNNRCTASEPMGDAGSPGVVMPGVVLGSRGESCTVNSDCGKNLVCVPTTGSGTGVCDLADFGIEPTGSTCSGECQADSDCYQLPVALQTAEIKSCPDIEAAIADGPIDCTAPASPTEKTLCFEQATYCGYKKTSKVWSCDTDTYRCVYNVSCDPVVGFDVPDGCPSYSRLGTQAGRSCNPDTKKCVGPVAPAGCTSDAKCKGEVVTGSTGGDLCTADECTCYSGNKQCYRKCSKDGECASGQVCDTAKTKLCVPSDVCSTDTECAIQHNNVGYKCGAGKCALTCAVDRDCSGSGINAAFNGMVCVSGLCQSVASDCQSASQCTAAPGQLKPFCVPKATGGQGVFSAITN